MYIGYFCGAEGAAKIFLPPIDGGHCPPSNFRRGALPPINFEILGIAPHQKFELCVPGVNPPRGAEFKILMGGIAQNFEIDGGQCPPSKI